MRPRDATASKQWVSGWPELVAEWHPTRNSSLLPSDVSYGSGRKVWWKCPHGPDHEWRASPNNRIAGGTGCPCCAGRQLSVTNSLATVRPDLARQWDEGRNGGVSPSAVLAGSTRPAFWRCDRVPTHVWRASPQDRLDLLGGCPFCLGVRVAPERSLAQTHPELAREWHPTRNGDLRPTDVIAGAARFVFWQCASHPEHEWRATVFNRARRSSGCPFCAGKRASPGHCLAALYPSVAAEWHPTRNGALSPADVTPFSPRSAWWRCAGGHEWSARVHTRTRRRATCRECAGRPALRRPLAGRDGASARFLREEHRRLEQLLAFVDVTDDTILRALVAELSAHLDAEVRVLHPALEGILAEQLASLRALERRLRSALRVLQDPRSAPAESLLSLAKAFREHVRVEEQVVVPSLESILGGAKAALLHDRLAATRTRGGA